MFLAISQLMIFRFLASYTHLSTLLLRNKGNVSLVHPFFLHHPVSRVSVVLSF